MAVCGFNCEKCRQSMKYAKFFPDILHIGAIIEYMNYCFFFHFAKKHSCVFDKLKVCSFLFR